MYSHQLLFALLLFLIFASGQKLKEPIPKDVSLIGCDTCQFGLKDILHQVNDTRVSTAYQKISELQILEILDSICNPDVRHGAWIRTIDIVQVDASLAFTFPGGLSKCDEECRTVAKSCKILLQDEIDRDELSSLLWKNEKNGDEIAAQV